jgi:hypothetical protein
MERRAKVELFEQIRREYEFGVGTVKGVARRLGVHGGWCGRRWRVRSRRHASGRRGHGRPWDR